MSLDGIHTTEYIAALKTLVGKPLWAAIAGRGTGSMVNMYIGEKIRRKEPVANPTIGIKARYYNSRYSLYIDCAAWRIETDNAVLCTSKSCNWPEGEMLRGLRQICYTTIGSIQFYPPSGDLHITLLTQLNKEIRLKVFCDCMNEDADGDNYWLHTPGIVYTLKAGGKVAKWVKPKKAL